MALKLALCFLSVFLCHAADIPVRMGRSFDLFIEARINGSDIVHCNLDSGGGDRIYLDRGRALKMGIQPTGAGLSSGPGDGYMKQDLRAQTEIEVAGIKFPNVPVLLQDRPYDDYGCVIGQTVFRKFIVEIDYDGPFVRLRDPASFRYTGQGKALPITLDKANPFVVSSVTVNGKPVEARLSVDTGGGPALVMLSKSFVDRNRLLDQGLSLRPVPQFGMDGPQAKVVSAQVDKFAVGPFEIPQATVHLWQTAGFGGTNGPDGLLCVGFLRRFKLFFDYEHKSLTLEPNGRTKLE
jgi:hypothetical protein